MISKCMKTPMLVFQLNLDYSSALVGNSIAMTGHGRATTATQTKIN